VVDVALLLHDPDNARWELFRKDHTTGLWQLDTRHERLPSALERLNVDPERAFLAVNLHSYVSRSESIELTEWH